MDLSFIEAQLKEKEYAPSVKLKEPSIENVKAVCALLNIKDVYNMMANLDVDLVLLGKFSDDVRKCEAFLTACLEGDVSNIKTLIEREGAFFLEVKNDFFTRFMQRSGLLKYLLANMTTRANVL